MSTINRMRVLIAIGVCGPSFVFISIVLEKTCPE